MFKRCIIAGAIALFSAPLLAGADTNQPGSETIAVQAGQGAVITMTIPVQATQVEAPYALTGQTNAPAPVPQVYQTYGQGLPIWAPQ